MPRRIRFVLAVASLVAASLACTLIPTQPPQTLPPEEVLPSATLPPTDTAEPSPTPLPEPTETSAPTPEPTAPSGPASIVGTVWHDRCSPPYDSSAPPPEGCVELPDGGMQANGILEAGEEGISGVFMRLLPRQCHQEGMAIQAQTTTGSDGAYAFTGLEAGDYCITIDPLDSFNEPILIPGGWTHPASGIQNGKMRFDLNLSPGEIIQIDFGWDYQFAG